jgi:hypothetical protein
MGSQRPRYIARILAKFPKVSTDSLLEPDWVEAAQKRSLARNRKPHIGT